MPSAWCAIRAGCAGSETSNSETCAPWRRPSAVASWPTPSSRPSPDRVQVGRVPGQVERAGDLRARGIGQVERVERVDLPEGDEVALVADEAHRVDALAAARGRRRRPTCASLPPCSRSTVTALWLGCVCAPFSHSGSSVLATRRTPPELRQRVLVEHEARPERRSRRRSCDRGPRCRSGGSRSPCAAGTSAAVSRPAT